MRRRSTSTGEPFSISKVLTRSPAAAWHVPRSPCAPLPDLQPSKRLVGRDGFEVGAGTVITATQANAAMKAGAAFLVSPWFDYGVWAAGKESGDPGNRHRYRSSATPGHPPSILPRRHLWWTLRVKALSHAFTQLFFTPIGGITLDE